MEGDSQSVQPEAQAGLSKPHKPLRLESLRLRVERNRIRFIVFVTTFVLGSAVLLTLAFIAVPGSLIGLVWGGPEYWDPFLVVLAIAFGVALVGGGIAAYSQIANAEHWVRSQFRGRDLDPARHPRLVRAVEEMSIAGGMAEPPALLLLQVDSINACAIGATRTSPVIAVSAGLLNDLSVPEQQAVIATLIARITRGDIMVGTGLAALMGPLKYLRGIQALKGDKKKAAAGGPVTTLAETGSGPTWVDSCVNTAAVGSCDGCDGCGDGCDGGDDCGGIIVFIVIVIVIAVLTYAAVVSAAWLVTFWGRALHRTGLEKADAEGMLLLRDPSPMLSALRKAITSSNEIADGDPSYDGIFYAPTSGKPGVEKVERRRYDRLRQVLGIEGLAAELPEHGPGIDVEPDARPEDEDPSGLDLPPSR
jgi:Zn-dependent protease with chaperone function